MKDVAIKKTETVIIALGLSALAVSFVYWAASDKDLYKAGFLAAAGIALLFAWFCIGFIKSWIPWWFSEAELTICDNSAERPESKRQTAVLFFTFLAVDFLFVLVAINIRWLYIDPSEEHYGLNSFLYTDVGHYLELAENGYSPESFTWPWKLVFYPGYPVIVKLVNCLIGNYMYSAVLTSALFYAGSSCVLYNLIELDFGKEAARRAVKYLAVLPASFFFAVPMSESLFFFCSSLCILFARKKKWLLSCLMGMYSAFTRSVGVFIVAPLVFEAVYGLLHEKEMKQKWITGLLPILLVPLGTFAYLLVNYRITGNAFAFAAVEKEHWGQSMCFFFDTAAHLADTGIAALTCDRLYAFFVMFPNLACIFAVSVLAVFTIKRIRPSYSVWFIVYFFFTVGVSGLISSPRYFSACVPLYPMLAVFTKNRKLDILLVVLSIICSFAYVSGFSIGAGVH